MKNRINNIRQYMQKHQLNAFIIPSNDPHFSEYVANYWKCREWISGFSGSAGTVVITNQKAALWTDSRYFLQAEAQLADSEIELKKTGLAKTENIDVWLKKNLSEQAKIGIDEKLFSILDFDNLQQQLLPLELIASTDPFVEIWQDRPAMPQSKAFLLSTKICGKSTGQKVNDIVNNLDNGRNAMYIVSALDEIAWLCNIRGEDIEYNPTAIAYAIIDYPKVHLFIDPNKISQKDKKSIKKENIELHDYEHFYDYLLAIPKNKNIIVNPKKLNISIYNELKKKGQTISFEKDLNGVICSLKSVKNKTELVGFRRAMLYDGVALVKFFYWLEKNIAKKRLNELSIAEKLHFFRAQNINFIGESFETISGYAAHGAIVHYKVTPSTASEIKRKGFLLIDSGAQYKCGTTDITRTLHLGKPSSEEKINYTLVLKGHIALANAKFPIGTRGSQLDILARQPLYSHAKNFLHGTGHGVGHFLNVHEGPQSIRTNENPVTFKVGMITSNEPGVYLTGKYGIRIENLIVCIPFTTTEFGDFLQFETYSLCPIETKAIDKKLLTNKEIQWLNNYHKIVYKKLSPLLNNTEKAWLKKKTAKI